MGKKIKRISTDGSDSGLMSNAFAGLDVGNLPSAKEVKPIEPLKASPAKSPKSRGRLDVGRQKTGRGGKTVTVATGFKGIANDEKVSLAKTIQKRCGVGGAVKGGNIEIQGDKREEVKEILEDAGFRVVFVGG